MFNKILLLLSFIIGSILISPTFAVEVPSEGFGSVQPVIDNGPNLPGIGENTEGKIVDVVKGFVNRTLGILGLIALIVLLRGGFQMLTAGGDETKYANGFTYLKNAAIGLAIIGFAWFIVSFIFWLANTFASDAAGSDAGTLN